MSKTWSTMARIIGLILSFVFFFAIFAGIWLAFSNPNSGFSWYQLAVGTLGYQFENASSILTILVVWLALSVAVLWSLNRYNLSNSRLTLLLFLGQLVFSGMLLLLQPPSILTGPGLPAWQGSLEQTVAVTLASVVTWLVYFGFTAAVAKRCEDQDSPLTKFNTIPIIWFVALNLVPVLLPEVMGYWVDGIQSKMSYPVYFSWVLGDLFQDVLLIFLSAAWTLLLLALAISNRFSFWMRIFVIISVTLVCVAIIYAFAPESFALCLVLSGALLISYLLVEIVYSVLFARPRLATKSE